MEQRPKPDIDNVREALREHDQREASEPPRQDDAGEQPEDDDDED